VSAWPSWDPESLKTRNSRGLQDRPSSQQIQITAIHTGPGASARCFGW